MFTTRHYEKIAATLRSVGAHRTIVGAFVVMFSEDNPRFDEKRFREAAGVR